MVVTKLLSKVNLVRCKVVNRLVMNVVSNAHKIVGSRRFPIQLVIYVVLRILDCFGGQVIVIVSIEIPDDNMVAQRSHGSLAIRCASDVRWSHICRISANGTHEGFFYLAHFSAALGIGEGIQIGMVPGMGCDLVPFVICSL